METWEHTAGVQFTYRILFLIVLPPLLTSIFDDIFVVFRKRFALINFSSAALARDPRACRKEASCLSISLVRDGAT